jgi:Skp family chaperone for outer membrane proteins
MHRRGAGLVLALAMAVQPGGLSAQSPELPKSSIVTLEPDQLFSGTRYGRALQKLLEDEAEALTAENRKIDAALEAEERDLTDRRATLKPEDFRPLADAFDVKANDLRTAQEAKSRELVRLRETQRQDFFRNIGPVIGDYMVQRGAVAVLDKSTVIVSLGSIDVTQDVIAMIDARLGDGPEPVKP